LTGESGELVWSIDLVSGLDVELTFGWREALRQCAVRSQIDEKRARLD